MGHGCGAWAAGSTQGLSAVLAAGDGRLHKAVSVGPRVHIIEELQIFSPGQPVQNLLLDPDRVRRRKRPSAHLGYPSVDEPSESGVLQSTRGGPWGVALVGHVSQLCCGWWPWLPVPSPHPCVCAGTAVCCLTLGCSPGARGQLQPVPELWGLPSRPGPLLCLEQLQVPSHQPLPPWGDLQVRASEGPFPSSPSLCTWPQSAFPRPSIESLHSFICVHCLGIIIN